MDLPKEAIEEFQNLWAENTGDSLSFENSKEQAIALLSVLEASMKPTNRGSPSK